MRVSCQNLPNYTAKREPTCGCLGCWRKWAESGRLTAARECAEIAAKLDAEYWAIYKGRKPSRGVFEKARDYTQGASCGAGEVEKAICEKFGLEKGGENA